MGDIIRLLLSAGNDSTRISLEEYKFFKGSIVCGNTDTHPIIVET